MKTNFLRDDPKSDPLGGVIMNDEYDIYLQEDQEDADNESFFSSTTSIAGIAVTTMVSNTSLSNTVTNSISDPNQSAIKEQKELKKTKKKERSNKSSLDKKKSKSKTVSSSSAAASVSSSPSCSDNMNPVPCSSKGEKSKKKKKITKDGKANKKSSSSSDRPKNDKDNKENSNHDNQRPTLSRTTRSKMLLSSSSSSWHPWENSHAEDIMEVPSRIPPELNNSPDSPDGLFRKAWSISSSSSSTTVIDWQYPDSLSSPSSLPPNLNDLKTQQQTRTAPPRSSSMSSVMESWQWKLRVLDSNSSPSTNGSTSAGDSAFTTVSNQDSSSTYYSRNSRAVRKKNIDPAVLATLGTMGKQLSTQEKEELRAQTWPTHVLLASEEGGKEQLDPVIDFVAANKAVATLGTMGRQLSPEEREELRAQLWPTHVVLQEEEQEKAIMERDATPTSQAAATLGTMGKELSIQEQEELRAQIWPTRVLTAEATEYKDEKDEEEEEEKKVHVGIEVVPPTISAAAATVGTMGKKLSIEEQEKLRTQIWPKHIVEMKHTTPQTYRTQQQPTKKEASIVLSTSRSGGFLFSWPLYWNMSSNHNHPSFSKRPRASSYWFSYSANDKAIDPTERMDDYDDSENSQDKDDSEDAADKEDNVLHKNKKNSADNYEEDGNDAKSGIQDDFNLRANGPAEENDEDEMALSTPIAQNCSDGFPILDPQVPGFVSHPIPAPTPVV